MQKDTSLKLHRFITVLFIGCLVLLTICISVYISLYIGEIYREDKVREVVRIIEKEVKPSYKYLKSVTVMIHGIGDYPHDLSEEARQTLKNKYDMESETGNNCEWIGTGVIVRIKDGYTYILTNAHVTGNEMINVTIFVENDYKKVEAQIIKSHNKLDLALIKIKGTIKEKQSIKGITTAKPQDKIYVVGHHLASPYIYGEGVFAGYVELYDKIQVPCMWGNSGSGIFDKNGNLIALICAIESRGIFIFPIFDITHALAIDGISIEMFLNNIKELK